jgi:hypothetical protein
MPYEVQNCFVATQMLRYGQVIPESVRRGYIKGTNIENGSRYLSMLKCDKTLPNKTNFSRFEVRIFANNNRTECKYCRTTDHPSYLCRDKPARVVRCYNCNQMVHIARDCNIEPICSFCKQSGHSTGADPGFQVRGAHLKQLRRAEGGAKIFGVFRVKNHDFTPKIIFFQF